MRFKIRKQNLHEERVHVPDWIRKFSYPGWTNVFQLVPNNKSLYPEDLRPDWKTQFNDWNGKILLLAKDGCPTRVIREAVNEGESQPWRYAQQELGDEGGWRTNNRLHRFASVIPGGKLYGSATANMLYDNPGWSRSLPGFYGGPLHEFLKPVLGWVLESMPRVEWVACLGKEAWFLTCMTLGNPSAAERFKEYRESHLPVVGSVGNKRITAFPLYHPAALGNAINEMGDGWQALGAALSGPLDRAVDEKLLTLRATRALTACTTQQQTPPTHRNFDTRNSAAKRHPIVTATLSRRQCRIKFMTGDNLIHVSPEYDSGNTWAKIIAYARSTGCHAQGKDRGEAILGFQEAAKAHLESLMETGRPIPAARRFLFQDVS